MNSLVVIGVDSPPVKALSPDVPEGLDAAPDRVAAASTVRALIIEGTGRTFCDYHRERRA